MFDTSFYNQGRGLQSGLRAGAEIGGMIKGTMNNNSVEQAAARIQAGENQQAVISELMAQSPQAAQQLMDLLGGQQDIDAGVQEIIAIKQKVGEQVMQSAAMPMMLALQADDDEIRNKFINETASILDGYSPETAELVRGMTKLKGRQQFDAVAGTVKTLQKAGVFPDDPSQLQQSMPADVAKFEYWKQMNPNATEKEAREVYNKIIDPFYRSQASAQGAAGVKIDTEEKLNPILSKREADKIKEVEKTDTGGAKLAQAQQAVQQGQIAVDADKEQKAKALQASQEALRLTESIANNKNLGAVTGVAALTPTFNPESQDLINQANQLLALLTAENLKLMSGVLSETDIKMLRDLSSGLNVSDKGIKGSEQAVRARLTDIAAKLRGTLQSKGAVDVGGSEVIDWSSL